MADRWPEYLQPVDNDETKTTDFVPEYTDFSGGGGGDDVDKETQRYVDKSMDAVKAQNDARFSEVLNGIKTVGNQIDMQSLLLKETKASADAAKEGSTNMRWTIVLTGLSVIGILLACWAIWAQGVEMVTGLFSSEVIPPNDSP